MVSNKSRARPSRVSSPLVRNTTATNTPPTSGSWDEPALQENKPSYVENNLSALGVLEDMQPLGTRPGAKVKARVKELRKSLGGKRGGMGQEAADTPEGTPGPETVSGAPDVSSPRPLPIVDDEDDQDYQPKLGKKAGKTRLSRGAATPAGTPKPAITTAAVPTKTPTGAHARSSRSASAVKTKAPEVEEKVEEKVEPAEDEQDKLRPHKIRKLGAIIKAAKERAREVGNPELGEALHQLYLDSFKDDRLTYLLRAILEQTATSKEKAEFRDATNKAKKILRKQARENRKSQGEVLSATNGIRKQDSSPDDEASRPEMKARRSIETAVEREAEKPKLKLNMRGRDSSKDTSSNSKSLQSRAVTDEQETQTGQSDSGSGTSDLSSLAEDEQADPMDVDVDDHEAVAVAAPLPSKSLTVAQPLRNASMKRTSAEAEFVEDDGVLSAKKQKLRDTLHKEPIPQARVQESHLRDAERPRSLRHSMNNQHKTNGTPNGRAITAAQSDREGSMDADSDLTQMSSEGSSNGDPPTIAPVRTNKKKAKTKQSPEKKQTAIIGGDADGSAGKGTPIGHDDSDESDNNDFCTACGGSGFLLCCDGCDKSFHFACLDPPLTEHASELDEPWFCHKCITKRAGPQKQPRGLFSALLTNLENRNPSNYLLPTPIREYFAGVGTGKDGKFVEPSVTQKTRSKPGWEETTLDLLKTKDAKGNLILCYDCGKSATGRREIITCDACAAHWHLDCLNPPLANPPFRDLYNRKARDWMCPLHIDHDLREMDPARVARQRTFYMRRPKNAKVFDTALRRGQVNDGIIEVGDESSSEDESEWDEVDTRTDAAILEAGTVVRLPPKGIKLDFIDRVKATRQLLRGEPLNKRARYDTPVLSRDNFTSRSFVEKKTALSLVQFASQQQDLMLSGNQVENLLGTLIAEAPTEVVDQLATAERKQLSEDQRKQLLELQELIRRKLEVAAGDEAA